MREIHDAAVRILDTVGMKIDHNEALDYLRDCGCRVDREARRVKFPPEVTERCVARMRKAYADPNRVPQRMTVRYSHVRFRSEPNRIHHDFTVSTGGFCVFIYDLEGRRRAANVADVRAALRLADALGNIDYAGLPCSAQEIPHAQRPVRMAAELVKHTRKIGGIETFTARDVEYITRIAEVVAGGKEELRRNPVLIGYGEVRSPLCIDSNMADILIAYVKKGLPQTLDSMPNGGATAPVTAAGILAQGIAETLGGLILGYAVDEDAVIGIDLVPSYADARSGIFQYASAQRMPLIAARVQIMNEFYGVPSGIHGGKTDSCFPGTQAGVEKACSMLFPILAGAVGIGTVGHLENAVTFSPLQLVIDNEIVGYLRRSLRGIEVSDETLALDAIGAVGPGGNFLMEEHTVSRFREELFLSDLFTAMPWSAAHEREAGRMEKIAMEKARRLSAQEPKRFLTRHQVKAIDEIVAEACATTT
jgi:trimethylamine--corrinoid protein Co-methyltransferase